MTMKVGKGVKADEAMVWEGWDEQMLQREV
jgi:hypothetical protein